MVSPPGCGGFGVELLEFGALCQGETKPGKRYDFFSVAAILSDGGRSGPAPPVCGQAFVDLGGCSNVGWPGKLRERRVVINALRRRANSTYPQIHMRWVRPVQVSRNREFGEQKLISTSYRTKPETRSCHAAAMTSMARDNSLGSSPLPLNSSKCCRTGPRFALLCSIDTMRYISEKAHGLLQHGCKDRHLHTYFSTG
jgi:hypothetical protein